MGLSNDYLNKMSDDEYEANWQDFRRRYNKEFTLHKKLTKTERFKDVDVRGVTRPLFLNDYKNAIKNAIKLIAQEGLFELYKFTVGRKPKLDRPIFVIGLPHSGTSIMMTAISGHPDISNMSELNSMFHPRIYFDMEMSGHFLGKEDASDIDKKRLSQRLDFYRRLKGNRPRFLNKNPNNTVTVEYLQALFPDACFVHVIRDPRAMINSIIDNLPDDFETYDRFKACGDRVNPWPGVRPKEWSRFLDDNPFVQHAYQWKLSVDYVDSVADKLTNYLEIRYEDVCSDPMRILTEVWSFLGLPTDKDALDKAEYVNFSCKNYKYQQKFDSSILEKINAILGDSMIKHGYDV